MTMWEFSIRREAYHRMEQSTWAKFRKVGFSALMSFNADPKRLPKNEKQYFPLPLIDTEPQVSERHVKAFEDAMKQYKALKKV